MKIILYDERRKYSLDSINRLGVSGKFFLTKRGELIISKTDLLYKLRIKLSRREMEILRERLGVVLSKSPDSVNLVISEAETILNKKLRK